MVFIMSTSSSIGFSDWLELWATATTLATLRQRTYCLISSASRSAAYCGSGANPALHAVATLRAVGWGCVHGLAKLVLIPTLHTMVLIGRHSVRLRQIQFEKRGQGSSLDPGLAVVEISRTTHQLQRGGCFPFTPMEAVVGCVTARVGAFGSGARSRRNSVSQIQPLITTSLGISG